MRSILLRRGLTAVVLLATTTAAFGLAGEALWVGALVGTFLALAYTAMVARARFAGWIPRDEPAGPRTMSCLVILLVVLVSVIFGLAVRS